MFSIRTPQTVRPLAANGDTKITIGFFDLAEDASKCVMVVTYPDSSASHLVFNHNGTCIENDGTPAKPAPEVSPVHGVVNTTQSMAQPREEPDPAANTEEPYEPGTGIPHGDGRENQPERF